VEKKTTFGPACQLPSTTAQIRLTGIVSPSPAWSTIRSGTWYTSLDSDSVPNGPFGNACTERNDLTRRLVTRSTLVCDDHGWTDMTVLPEVYVGPEIQYGNAHFRSVLTRISLSI
jgi:hypothetical protein